MTSVLQAPRATIAVLVSGGLDSSILVARLAAEGHTVQPCYVRGGLVWQAVEERAADGFLAAIAQPRILPVVKFDLPMADIYGQHWSTTGQDVPPADSPDSAVFLPARNYLLVIKPAAWCRQRGIAELAVGTLAGNPFDDARPESFRELESAVNHGPGSPLRLVQPWSASDKRAVMLWGRDLPLELTFSCLAPVRSQHCGRCNKCAERQAAFAPLGRDPTHYADQQPARRAASGDQRCSA